MYIKNRTVTFPRALRGLHVELNAALVVLGSVTCCGCAHRTMHVTNAELERVSREFQGSGRRAVEVNTVEGERPRLATDEIVGTVSRGVD
jgi:hypothetical protein